MEIYRVNGRLYTVAGHHVLDGHIKVCLIVIREYPGGVNVMIESTVDAEIPIDLCVSGSRSMAIPDAIHRFMAAMDQLTRANAKAAGVAIPPSPGQFDVTGRTK